MHPLYNLKPINMGTAFAESQLSYDIRLASAHCVTVYCLNRAMVAPLVSTYRHKGTSLWLMRAGRALVNMGTTSAGWAEALNHQTGRSDLILTTLNFASGFLSTRDLHVEYSQYCRECLQDAVASKLEPWIPLLWHIAAVTACQIHGLRLRVRQCGAPDSAVPPSLRKMLPENCWTCGRLFCLCDKSPSVKATREEVATAELIGELIAVGTSGVPLPTDALQLCNESMPRVLGDHWLVKSADESQLGKGTVHRMFRQPGTRVSLPILVRFCMNNQLSLAGLALGEVIQRPSHKLGTRTPNRYRPASPTVIREELRKAVATGGVRSVQSVARRLGRCPKTLAAIAPDMVRAIKLANAAFHVAQRNLRVARWEAECHQVVDELLRQELPLTTRNAQNITGDAWTARSQRTRIFLRMRMDVEEGRYKPASNEGHKA